MIKDKKIESFYLCNSMMTKKKGRLEHGKVSLVDVEYAMGRLEGQR